MIKPVILDLIFDDLTFKRTKSALCRQVVLLVPSWELLCEVLLILNLDPDIQCDHF